MSRLAAGGRGGGAGCESSRRYTTTREKDCQGEYGGRRGGMYINDGPLLAVQAVHHHQGEGLQGARGCRAGGARAGGGVAKGMSGGCSFGCETGLGA